MRGYAGIFFGGIAHELEVRGADLQPRVGLTGRNRGKCEEAQDWQGAAEHKWALYRYTADGEASKGFGVGRMGVSCEIAGRGKSPLLAKSARSGATHTRVGKHTRVDTRGSYATFWGVGEEADLRMVLPGQVLPRAGEVGEWLLPEGCFRIWRAPCGCRPSTPQLRLGANYAWCTSIEEFAGGSAKFRGRLTDRLSTA